MIQESLIQRKQKDIQIDFCSKCFSCTYHMPYSEFHLDKKAQEKTRRGKNSILKKEKASNMTI